MFKKFLMLTISFSVLGCGIDKAANEKLDAKPYATAVGNFDGWQGYESMCASDYDIFVSPKKDKIMVRSLVAIDSKQAGRKADCRYALVSDIQTRLSKNVRRLNFSRSEIFVDIGFLSTSATVEECRQVPRETILSFLMASGYDGKVTLDPNLLLTFSSDVIQFSTYVEGKDIATDSRCAAYRPTSRQHK